MFLQFAERVGVRDGMHGLLRAETVFACSFLHLLGNTDDTDARSRVSICLAFVVVLIISGTVPRLTVKRTITVFVVY